MNFSALKHLSICFISLFNFAYCDIAPGSYQLCKEELDATPIKHFSTDNILLYSKCTQASLIQIQNNQPIIDGELIDQQFLSQELKAGDSWFELALTLYKLTQLRRVPDVTFLYTKQCYDLDKNELAKMQIPVFVGVNSPLYQNAHLITFVSSCPLARSYLGNGHENWSLEHAFSETLATHDKIPWQNKCKKIFWRGFLSDVIGWHEALDRRKCLVDLCSPPLYCTPREYISILSLYYPEMIDAALTTTAWGSKLLKPTDCKPNASIFEHIQYKYQIVLDGVHCTTPGYMWRLLSDCCVLKVESILYNWFYVNLIPWVHFVPVAADLHDIFEVYSYLEEHQELAENIAKNGREFAMTYLKPDDYLDFCVMCLELYADKQMIANKLFNK